MKIASFFTGCGGLDLGVMAALRLAGQQPEHILMCESDPYAQSVLDRHFPGVTILDDVRTRFKGKDIWADLVVAGFPCQDLSRAKRDKEGLKGERSGLFYDLCDRIRELDAQYVILENVENILRYEHLTPVLDELTSMGFTVEWSTISAQEIGAPIMRKRWFAFCHRTDQCKVHHFMGQPYWKALHEESPGMRYPKHGSAHPCGSVFAIDRPVHKDRPVTWPAPAASCPNWDEGPATWLRRAAKCYQKGQYTGIPLTLAVRLGPDWRHKLSTMRKDPSLITDDQWTQSQWFNPNWGDRLMGFPGGWTEPAPGCPSQASKANFSGHWLTKWDWGRRTQLEKKADIPHRLRLLGNTVVPQQAFAFARYIRW